MARRRSSSTSTARRALLWEQRYNGPSNSDDAVASAGSGSPNGDDAVAAGLESATGDARFVDRHFCHWGGFGHVRATLKGIDRLLEDGVAFDYVALLTGQDYPLRSSPSLARFFADAGGESFTQPSRTVTASRWRI